MTAGYNTAQQTEIEQISNNVSLDFQTHAMPAKWKPNNYITNFNTRQTYRPTHE